MPVKAPPPHLQPVLQQILREEEEQQRQQQQQQQLEQEGREWNFIMELANRAEWELAIMHMQARDWNPRDVAASAARVSCTRLRLAHVRGFRTRGVLCPPRVCRYKKHVFL